MKTKIPFLLIALRLLLAPIILSLAYFLKEDSKVIIVVLMYIGLVSDIFDGIIARHLNVSSEKLRRLDSQADMLFWLAIGLSTYILYPELIKTNTKPIVSIFIMELLCYVISIVRFGKETCTHALLSKLWGISLLVAFTFLIGFNYVGVPFFVAIMLGLVSHIDRILITLLLPSWTHDVPSAWHAWQIKKGRAIKRYKIFNG